ncbi:XdhC family protein [bacterium]|nr:XdhC family protein [bacterium]
MKQIYKDILESLERYEKIAVATVVSANGSTPRKEGAKMLIFPGGSFLHSVGGGIFESIVIQDALGVLRDGKTIIKKYSFNQEGKYATGAICGGQVEVMIEMVTNTPALLIVGGGHVGKALAKAASLLDFYITIVDDREEYAIGNEPESRINWIHTPPDFSAIPKINENTFVCLVSKGCPTDEAALRQVINSPARYIGMIGSKKKVQTVYKNMQADGFDPSLFKRIHAPIGIDIGGDSPEEIAISILAEIISTKNQKR